MARELYTQATDPNAKMTTAPQYNVQPQYASGQMGYVGAQQPGAGAYPAVLPPSPPVPAPGVYSQGEFNSGPAPAMGDYKQPLEVTAQADTRAPNSNSPPIYYPQTRAPMNSPPSHPPYGAQQQPGFPQQVYSPQQVHSPQPYPAMQQNIQPAPIQGMDVRNVKNLPRQQSGERDWSNGLCDCFDDCGTCVLAWCCPCVVYSQVKTRLDHLQRNGYPHPSGGDATGGDCFIHGCLSCFGWGWVLQIGNRGNVRERYRIEGGGCSDCLTACFCTPCELTQESREIELEENALLGAGARKA